MKFLPLAELFGQLESTTKRLQKIAYLKTFLQENNKEGALIFDMISGTYQKEIDKKTIGISLKTMMSVIGFVSKTPEATIEKTFNKMGDIGKVAIEYIKPNKQQSFNTQELTIQSITQTFEKIKATTGKNSNKIKKELLSNLFLMTTTDVENKFLARLLIDDLRIGVSEGVLKEAYTRYFFNYEPEEDREQYNTYLATMERKYNVTNSFREIARDTAKNKDNINTAEIKLGRPIKSMLGLRSTSVEHALSITGENVLADYKYDGLRVQIHNNKGQVQLFSRNLDEITKQFPEVVQFIKDNFSDVTFVMDAECIGYDFDKKKFLPFQILSRRILTKEIDAVSHISVVVKAFDLLFYEEKTIIDQPYSKRRELLDNLFINRPLKQKKYRDPQELINSK